MPNASMTGSCLCGAVTFTASEVETEIHACHCSMCRNWSGGPFLGAAVASVDFRDEENIGVYGSSEWAERGFCRNCGTHLFYRIKETGQHMIPVGVLEDGYDLVFENQVFIDEKPSFYRFANETQDMTGAEIFALYGASD